MLGTRDYNNTAAKIYCNIYIYIYIYILYIHKYIHIYYIYIHTYIHIYIYAYTHIYTHTHIHILTYTYTHTHMHIYSYTYINITTNIRKLQNMTSIKQLVYRVQSIWSNSLQHSSPVLLSSSGIRPIGFVNKSNATIF